MTITKKTSRPFLKNSKVRFLRSFKVWTQTTRPSYIDRPKKAGSIWA